MSDDSRAWWASSNDLPPVEIKGRDTTSTWNTARKYASLTQGWRWGITICCVLGTIVFLINIIILAWAETNFNGDGHGVINISSGSCDRTRNLSTWLHLLINVLGSALLAASNYCMQCLTSPTRRAINDAHKRRTWLDVGIPNFRNLRFLGWKKATLWLLLAASSIPLHLLWNSAIFEELAANDYSATLVTEDFLRGVDSYRFDQNLRWMQKNVTNHLQGKASSVVKFDNDQCLKHYTSTPFVSDFGNVVLISNARNNSDSWLAETEVSVTQSGLPYDWVCNKDDRGKEGNCNPSTIRAEDWTPFKEPLLFHVPVNGSTTVQHCYAEKRHPNCHLGVAPAILIVVAVCNFIKLLCFAVTLYLGTQTSSREVPLVTTGDAISSFLENPDIHTRGRALIKKELVKSQPSLAFASFADPSHPIQHSSARVGWHRAVSIPRWLSCLTPSVILIIVPIVLLTQGSRAITIDRTLITEAGFGKARPDMLVLPEVDFNIPSASLLANVPQILLSYTYLAYNAIFTVMLTTYEYTSYAIFRRGLRVSAPKKGTAQRNRYYLQLPYRFSIPMLVVSALLHWLVSQSIFLVRVAVYHTSGSGFISTDPEDTISAVGYSPLAVIISASVGFLFVVAVLVFAFARHYNGMMPLSKTCSAVISATCHVLGEESHDPASIAEKAIQFGVTGMYDQTDEKSSQYVTDLEDGDDAAADAPPLRGQRSSQLVVPEIFVENEDNSVRRASMSSEPEQPAVEETPIPKRIIMHASFSAAPVTPLENDAWYA